MRVLMDSSWIQFGPAGRGSYDWVAGASASPSTENRLKVKLFHLLTDYADGVNQLCVVTFLYDSFHLEVTA